MTHGKVLKYNDRFFDMITGKINDEKFVNDEMDEVLSIICSCIKYNTHNFDLKKKIVDSLNDKVSRFSKKNISEEEKDVPYKSITTAMHQAFYFIVRDMYNAWNNNGKENEYTKEEKCAQWFFIREFCFGSMFRFGPTGNFNVPYGGYDYNDKNFKAKIERIFSEDAKFLKEKTNTYCVDFAWFINDFDYQPNDFMFLDPPYDSTFSEYDGNQFSQIDHIRLCEVLKHTKCKWMMAIGKTEDLRLPSKRRIR